MAAAEIAELLGVSRQRVHQLRSEDPSFPDPVISLSVGPIWERAAVEEWARTNRRFDLDEE